MPAAAAPGGLRWRLLRRPPLTGREASSPHQGNTVSVEQASACKVTHEDRSRLRRRRGSTRHPLAALGADIGSPPGGLGCGGRRLPRDLVDRGGGGRPGRRRGAGGGLPGLLALGAAAVLLAVRPGPCAAPCHVHRPGLDEPRRSSHHTEARRRLLLLVHGPGGRAPGALHEAPAEGRPRELQPPTPLSDVGVRPAHLAAHPVFPPGLGGASRGPPWRRRQPPG
mmetsp:Transcript_6136/g.19298  ORF Transcript_6136/g.19298 Transcript_6136/m.19298 type:complete len:224 (-) Transcript_6136:240-911(-)